MSRPCQDHIRTMLGPCDRFDQRFEECKHGLVSCISSQQMFTHPNVLKSRYRCGVAHSIASPFNSSAFIVQTQPISCGCSCKGCIVAFAIAERTFLCFKGRQQTFRCRWVPSGSHQGFTRHDRAPHRSTLHHNTAQHSTA